MNLGCRQTRPGALVGIAWSGAVKSSSARSVFTGRRQEEPGGNGSRPGCGARVPGSGSRSGGGGGEACWQVRVEEIVCAGWQERSDGRLHLKGKEKKTERQVPPRSRKKKNRKVKFEHRIALAGLPAGSLYWNPLELYSSALFAAPGRVPGPKRNSMLIILPRHFEAGATGALDRGW